MGFLDKDVRSFSDIWMGVEVAIGNDDILDSPDYDLCTYEQRIIAWKVYHMDAAERYEWLKTSVLEEFQEIENAKHSEL